VASLEPVSRDFPPTRLGKVGGLRKAATRHACVIGPASAVAEGLLPADREAVVGLHLRTIEPLEERHTELRRNAVTARHAFLAHEVDAEQKIRPVSPIEVWIGGLHRTGDIEIHAVDVAEALIGDPKRAADPRRPFIGGPARCLVQIAQAVALGVLVLQAEIAPVLCPERQIAGAGLVDDSRQEIP